MRAYRDASEEARRTRDLLKEWREEHLLTAEQYQRMEQETVCDFRRTNIFLRLVLFLFTVILTGAAIGLFFTLFISHGSDRATGVFLMIFAAASYAGAEIAVAKARLYRHGIEEALAVCAAGLLCLGLQFALPGFVVPIAGGAASLWMWHRFGFPYAPLAAMIFAAWAPFFWTSTAEVRHLIVAAMYVGALVTVVAIRPRHRFTYLDIEFSIAEALLWLGIYLAVNLQLSPARLPDQWRAFYWATWVLTWCIPPAILARGLRAKDRLVIAAGAAAAILTLATNKSYLGWQRHSWDPMLLGALLIGVALVIRRWLAQAPDGIRRGFTARRLSAKEGALLNAGIGAIGIAAPQTVTAAGQPHGPQVRFGGGDSGGGGATSEF